MARCIELDTECAIICYTAAQLICMGSIYAREMCKICVEVCTACAEECSKHDNEHCKECAAACKECANECAKM